MEKLNDDCMLEIFKYLPIIDRLRAEAVSRKWQSSVRKSWSSFKYFTLRDTRTRKYHERCKNYHYLFNNKVFKSLLRRFGKYLLSIDLSSESRLVQNLLSPISIRYIKQFCPKLQALNLGNIFQNNRENLEFAPNSDEECECEPRLSQMVQILQKWKVISNLEEFQVKICHVKLASLTALIFKMKKLKCLHISFELYYNIQDISISGFPFSTLNEIIFESCWTIDEDTLIEVVKNIQNLRSLVLLGLQSYTIFHHLLPSQYLALKNLSIDVIDESDADLDRNIRIAQSFVNLKRLNLKGNFSLLTDQFVITIAHCYRELIFLDISVGSEVTNNGIKYIVTLPKLQCLFINDLDEFNGKTLNKMANLEVLSCVSCEELEDDGLCSIVRQSKLRVIDIRSCKKITNKFLDAVIQEVATREKSMDLTLMIKNTQITLKSQENISPLLRIVQNIVNEDFYKEYGYFPKRHLFESY